MKEFLAVLALVMTFFMYQNGRHLGWRCLWLRGNPLDFGAGQGSQGYALGDRDQLSGVPGGGSDQPVGGVQAAGVNTFERHPEHL